MTVIIGIGNKLRGDDGVGHYIVSKLKSGVTGLKTHIIDAETVPENYIQKIVNLKPDRVIIIDAIDFGGKTGDIKWFTSIDSANISISTHNLPPGLFIDFIQSQTHADIKIIAIQPEQLKFGMPLSKKVKESANKLIGDVVNLLTYD